MKKKPLYVRAVVPDYAERDFARNAYSAWFLAHADMDKLDDEVIDGLYRQWHAEQDDEDINGSEAMEFFDWLEDRDGYKVLNSSWDGWAVLPVNELAPDELKYYDGETA